MRKVFIRIQDVIAGIEHASEIEIGELELTSSFIPHGIVLASYYDQLVAQIPTIHPELDLNANKSNQPELQGLQTPQPGTEKLRVSEGES